MATNSELSRFHGESFEEMGNLIIELEERIDDLEGEIQDLEGELEEAREQQQ